MISPTIKIPVVPTRVQIQAITCHLALEATRVALAEGRATSSDLAKALRRVQQTSRASLLPPTR